jgi:hypothetical protein
MLSNSVKDTVSLILPPNALTESTLFCVLDESLLTLPILRRTTEMSSTLVSTKLALGADFSLDYVYLRVNSDPNPSSNLAETVPIRHKLYLFSSSDTRARTAMSRAANFPILPAL